MATAKRAFGTLLKRETTPSSGTYTTIGGAENITWPSIETDFADTTDMEASSAFKTQVPTLNSLGDVSLDLFFDSADATHEQLIADQVAQTIRLYQLVSSDNGTCFWAFNAYVKSFAVTSQKSDVVKARVTLAPTGAPTRTT